MSQEQRSNSNVNIHSQTEVEESHDMIGIRKEMEQYKKTMENESEDSNGYLHTMVTEATIHATQGSSSPIDDDGKIRNRQAREDEDAADGFWKMDDDPNLISLKSITPSIPARQMTIEQDSSQKVDDKRKNEVATNDKKHLSLEGHGKHNPKCGCNECFEVAVA